MRPLRGQQKKRTVRHILEQRYGGHLAVVDVIRKECAVTISWEFRPFIENPNKYNVMGLMREMSLIPDPSYDMDSLVAKADGKGSVQLDLEEGCSYYFEFFFDDVEQMGKCTVEEYSKNFCDRIYFQVAVPLSEDSKALFKRAEKIVRDPKEMVSHESKKYLGIQDKFDEELKAGIEQIKRKNISDDEKEDQIEKFKEHLESMKDRLGM
jgi:hypothetical protein